MKQFTPGERRGTIMLLAVMTVIAAFLIFNKGQHHSTPDAVTADTIVVSTSKPTADSTKHSGAARNRKSQKQSGGKAGETSRKKATTQKTVPQGKQRHHLDEGV